jgi:hypothetical protein
MPQDPYDLSDPELPFWLALNAVRGIGPARFRLLLDGFGTAESVWRADPMVGWQLEWTRERWRVLLELTEFRGHL